MSVTPADSGRSSPAARPPRRQLEDELRKGDKNYRRYASNIERALASFDSARLEWPDYISFLGRLLKAIQAHPPATDSLPYKSNVANRLAQCLKPSLPSGVHQKALEVYSFIFALIGKQSLALDLTIYLPGLSAVLGFASLSIRPSFLSLLETYILPINGSQLRPALKALILSLLPGLEEESSEDFERTLGIVDRLKEAVNENVRGGIADTSSSGGEYFWQCLFLASISSVSRRQGALAYLSKRLPKLVVARHRTSNSVSAEAEHDDSAPADRLTAAAEAVVSPEPGLLLRCMITGLEDGQMLVQRGFLDLLLSHLPLDSPVLGHRATSSDLVRLVNAATGVVARRDMSLNRRLWSWFLGPEVDGGISEQDTSQSPESTKVDRTQKSSAGLVYFERHGATFLKRGILHMLSDHHTDLLKRAKPFRICLSLMDRWEIGSAIVPHIFVPAMENVYKYQTSASKQDFQDVLRSASSFFDGVESGVIWGKIAELSTSALELEDENNHKILLAEFIIDNFNVREEDMLAIHAPLIILLLLASIHRLDQADPRLLAQGSQPKRLENVLSFIEQLVNILPESKMSEVPSEPNPKISQSSQQIVESIQALYQNHRGDPYSLGPDLNLEIVQSLVLNNAARMIVRMQLQNVDSDSFVLCCRIFSSVLSKLPVSSNFDLLPLISIAKAKLIGLETSHQDSPGSIDLPTPTIVKFTAVSAVTSMLMSMASISIESDWQASEIFTELVATLVRHLWHHLTPSCPKYHLEAVRCLWQLEQLLETDHSIEAYISQIFANARDHAGQEGLTVEHARRFSVLWNHTSYIAGQPGRPKAKPLSRSFSANSDSQSLRSRSIGDNQVKLYRPLFLLLDACDDGNAEVQAFIRGWLKTLPNASHVFDVLITKIAASHSSSTRPSIHETVGDSKLQQAHQNRDVECIYYMRHLSELLGSKSTHVWSAMLEQHVNLAELEDDQNGVTLLAFLSSVCLQILQSTAGHSRSSGRLQERKLGHASASLLLAILTSPVAASLASTKLERPLITLLREIMHGQRADSSSQVALLDLILAALKVNNSPMSHPKRPRLHQKTLSIDVLRPPNLAIDESELGKSPKALGILLDQWASSEVVKCIQEGIQSANSTFVIEHWIQFLIELLPALTATLFQCIIPLVEAFCMRIRQVFQGLNATFNQGVVMESITSEPAFNALLSGLEHLLITGHEQMSAEDPKTAPLRSPEPSQGFFGNVVSGVFSGEAQKNRPSTQNTRLTVILCFQDALRICLSLWSWGSYGSSPEQADPTCLASFAYISQRLRNKTRKILDHLFALDVLECLETLVVAWMHHEPSGLRKGATSIINLLHVLDSSTPKQTMPALFNSIYSRTSPASIEPQRMSTLTSDLTDLELAQFLLEYTQSLDDDAMDEIWSDCMTFMRDVVANPLPHAQILPTLMQFLITLAEKVDKTNFGEQRKMRRELGDLFLRLLIGTFTTRPGGISFEITDIESEHQVNENSVKGRAPRRRHRHVDLVIALATVIPRLTIVLPDNDRLLAAVSNICSNIISPLVHSKTFPEMLRREHLIIWQQLTEISQASKVWKKDLSDLLMHPRLFSAKADLAFDPISNLIRQVAMSDKDRLSDICSRISPPTSAGIMFGVGANAARTEGDKKTQLQLRRMTYLILAGEEDSAVTQLALIEERISELLTATVASSPSSATRAEVFMLLRAIVLRTSSIHLAPLWPIVTAELQRAISSALSQSPDFELFNVPSLLQACKLLDLLLVISPDEFQMQEWLFITDTIEAVYRPGHWEPIALTDDIAEELGASGATLPLNTPTTPATEDHSMSDLKIRHRSPLLTIRDNLVDMSKDGFVGKVLRPFFAQLSIHAYEATYSMKSPDWEACRRALVEDLFDDTTIVG